MSISKNPMLSGENRRTFIKQLGLGSGSVYLSPLLSQCSFQSESQIFKNFRKPKAEARPFFRWWWNGNRLSKEEILRELKLMKAAGIGGIEINPIEMPEEADKLVFNEVKWLSDAWIEYLEYTIEKANDLGLITDLIVGTGWPFGGEFLKPEETIQGLRVEKIELQGPATAEVDIPKSADGGARSQIKKVILFPAEPGNMGDGTEIVCDPDLESVSVDVPEGEHTLYILIWQNNFRSVMHGAPGGAGPVLDHFNKNAVEKYLNHMSDAIKQKTGKDTLEGIRAMFCDSIELNGANWTHGFEQVFKDRRGYDILPYLPLLLTRDHRIKPELEDELRRARYDYSLTLSELFMENFVIPFHNWCHKNGTLSRYQAYGFPWLNTDLIDGNMAPDIPEGDQWLFNDAWQPYADVDQIRYAIWNKYASSGAHVAGKKIISSEAMTNTSGVFRASLRYIKQATDLNIASGINHLVLHGFNYSPPEAGFPGWVRYGSYFTEQNPWWQYMPQWSEYCARLSQIFQDSTPVAQVAIMGPTFDIWSQYGLDRNPFNLQPWYLHALWQALNHNGYSSDFINGNLLKNASLENGKLIIGAMKYEILMLCDAETIPSDIANKIEELTSLGARIILIGKKPYRAPSMIGALKQNGIVAKAIENAMYSGILMAPSPDVALQKAPEKLMTWTNELMKNCGLLPGIYFSNAQPQLFHIHHRDQMRDILFMANVHRKNEYSTLISLDRKTAFAHKLDPETGEKTKLPVVENNQLNIVLRPLESILIVFEDRAGDEDREPDMPTSTESQEIGGPWTVTLTAIDKNIENITLEKLIPLNQIKGLESFGGEILYETKFEIENKNFSFLEIEQVHDTAEVILNGKNLGVSWWGNNRFYLKNRLHTGTNTLEIKVTTLLANYCAALKTSRTAIYWTARNKSRKPVKCGLEGKITLG
jgi:hypothetical protein